MGHKDDNTFQAYIGRTSGVDVQYIINDEAPDQAFIDFVASMETMVDRPRGSSAAWLFASTREKA